MIKRIEATGRNEEAAIAAALVQLGLERDDVSVEVLERAKSGFLGIGATPAKILVSYEVPDEEEPVLREEAAPVSDKKEEAPEVEIEAAKEVFEPKKEESRTEEPEDTEEKIRDFLSGLLEKMEVSASPLVETRSEGGYQVYLEGEHVGALIGHRGETLDAIQQLTNCSVNRGRAKRVRIHIDVENYRAKREESLQRLAQKVAGKVVKYRRNITLEPMNAYERHVIHEALQGYEDVVTYSTGSEPSRRIVVAYTKGKYSY